MKSLDRVGIRRTVSVIQKAATQILEDYLFELNDELTRASLSNTVGKFLGDLKNRKAFYDYKVVCDETNNSPKTIDNNRLQMDIYLQPLKSVEFLTLNFVASSTGASFDVLQPQVEVFKDELDEYLHRLGYE